jgi:hypothetical protein
LNESKNREVDYGVKRQGEECTTSWAISPMIISTILFRVLMRTLLPSTTSADLEYPE